MVGAVLRLTLVKMVKFSSMQPNHLAAGGFAAAPTSSSKGWNTDDMVCLGLNGTGGSNMATAVGAIDDLANAIAYLPHYPTFPVTDCKADRTTLSTGWAVCDNPIMWVKRP